MYQPTHVNTSVWSFLSNGSFSTHNTRQYNKHHHLQIYPLHPLQSTTPPSSKYHTTLFKVPHHPLQIYPLHQHVLHHHDDRHLFWNNHLRAAPEDARFVQQMNSTAYIMQTRSSNLWFKMKVLDIHPICIFQGIVMWLMARLTLFNVPHHPLQSTTPPSSKYHTTLFKVLHHPLQSTTPSSSKYHTTLFKVPHHPYQSTTPPSSKYHTTLFKISYHPLQSTTPPSSKYHTTLFKVSYLICIFQGSIL